MSEELCIAICICTRRRRECLKSLLDSIDSLNVRACWSIRVIVIENDNVEYSIDVVQKFEGKFNYEYHLENNIGIVYARNRCLEYVHVKENVVFVDDDQILTRNWLIEVVNCGRANNCQIIYGYNLPVFSRTTNEDIKRFFTPKEYLDGQLLEIAGTDGIFFFNCTRDLKNLKFDQRFNLSGGEDIHLVKRMIKLGHVLRFARKAESLEIVPPERTKMSYAIKRKFSHGLVSVKIHRAVDEFRWGLFLRKFLVISIKVPLKILIAIFRKSRRMEWILLVAYLVGYFSGAVNAKYDLYSSK